MQRAFHGAGRLGLIGLLRHQHFLRRTHHRANRLRFGQRFGAAIILLGNTSFFVLSELLRRQRDGRCRCSSSFDRRRYRFSSALRIFYAGYRLFFF